MTFYIIVFTLINVFTLLVIDILICVVKLVMDTGNSSAIFIIFILSVEFLIPMLFLMQPIELWTGKQVFSVLLRPNASVRVYVTLNVKEKNFKKGKYGFDETMCANDGWVYFRNSELISGQLGKATLGEGKMECNAICSKCIR